MSNRYEIQKANPLRKQWGQLGSARSIDDIFIALESRAIDQRAAMPHKMIREDYRCKTYLASSYHQAVQILTAYYQYHYTSWLNCSPLPSDTAFSRMRQIIDSKQKGGFVAAVKNAIHGRQGGIIDLISLIADDFEQKSAEDYIRFVIDMMINPLDFDNKVAFCREYLDKYARHLLPYDHLMSPEELASQIESLVRYHINVRSSFRQMLQ